MLSIIQGKFELPEIKESLNSKHFTAERLSQIFAEMLFTSIEISDFTKSSSSSTNKHQEKVFSLVMKFLKILQAYPA